MVFLTGLPKLLGGNGKLLVPLRISRLNTLKYSLHDTICFYSAELPEGVGYCDKENMYLAVPTEGLNQHWSLYVGNKPLNRATALSNGYLITTNDTHVVLRVPLFAVGIIYEVNI